MKGKRPKWESELWSCLSVGDNERCPIYEECRVRLSGRWCPDNDKLRMAALFDSERFDLSDCDFIESGQHCGVIRLVEILAERWVREWGISSPPVPIELALKVEEEHQIEVRPVSLRAHHGATWFLNDGTVVQIKHDDTASEKRFTLFHELFHILCQRQVVPAFRKTGARRGSFVELLANVFAGFVLMPEEWVRGKWEEVKDLDGMAEIFDVPKAAMCIRLKRLGLI